MTQAIVVFFRIVAHCTRAGYFNGPFVKSEKLSQVASSLSADKKMSQEDFYDFTADLQLQRGRESLYFIIFSRKKKVEKLWPPTPKIAEGQIH